MTFGFAANLTYLFREVDLPDRFERAAAAGFEAVEFHFPTDRSVSELRERLRGSGLKAVQSNVPSTMPEHGDWGLAAIPNLQAVFRNSVLTGLDYAALLDIRQLHVLAGILPHVIDWEIAWGTYIENLAWASGTMKQAGVRALIEPINVRDTSNYFLPTVALARRALAEVGSDNLFMQIDAYHCAVMGSDPIEEISRSLPLTRHLQISGFPGRNEPDNTQQIDYPALFSMLIALDYDGWIGCEYRPRGRTEEGLDWLRPFGVHVRKEETKG